MEGEDMNDEYMTALMEQARLFPRQMVRVYEAMDKPTNSWTEIRPTLPDICLELRASVTGQSDPWPDPVMQEVVVMLEQRLATWWDGKADETDRLVKAMVEEAVKTGRARLDEARRDGTWWEGWNDQQDA